MYRNFRQNFLTFFSQIFLIQNICWDLNFLKFWSKNFRTKISKTIFLTNSYIWTKVFFRVEFLFDNKFSHQNIFGHIFFFWLNSFMNKKCWQQIFICIFKDFLLFETIMVPELDFQSLCLISWIVTVLGIVTVLRMANIMEMVTIVGMVT